MSFCADLVPREVAEAWLTYLREELPTVGFKCSTQKQAAHLSQGRTPKAGRGKGRGHGRGRANQERPSASLAMQGSDSLGAEALLQLLKNYTRNMDIKTAITVGESGSSFVSPLFPSNLWSRVIMICSSHGRMLPAHCGISGDGRPNM